jgi:hypothetical protein
MQEETDKSRFKIILLGLAELYGKEPSDTTLDLYYNALSDLEYEDILRVANILARTSKFFPKPVEFREHIVPDLDTEVSLALDKVEKAFYGAGVYQTVIFDDPVIHKVIESLGGWVAYCEQPEKDVTWWKKDFAKLYKQYAPRIKTGEITAPKQLLGQHAMNNVDEPGWVDRPALIGDHKELKQIKG